MTFASLNPASAATLHGLLPFYGRSRNWILIWVMKIHLRIPTVISPALLSVQRH